MKRDYMEPFDLSSEIEQSELQASTIVPQSAQEKLSEPKASTSHLCQASAARNEPQASTAMSHAATEETASMDGVEDAPKFWNQDARKPMYRIKVERPEHRAICILAAQGYTTSEIAEQTGWTTAMIQNVRKQEWAQTYIANLMEKTGRKVVMTELQGAAKDAAELIIKSVRGEIPDQKPADRCKDAHKLLDRLYGTAPQVVMHGNIDAAELSDEELAATIASGNS